MKRSLSVVRWGLTWAAGLLMAACPGVLAPAATACERHLDGHQNSADTQGEVQGERR